MSEFLLKKRSHLVHTGSLRAVLLKLVFVKKLFYEFAGRYILLISISIDSFNKYGSMVIEIVTFRSSKGVSHTVFFESHLHCFRTL